MHHYCTPVLWSDPVPPWKFVWPLKKYVVKQVGKKKNILNFFYKYVGTRLKQEGSGFRRPINYGSTGSGPDSEHWCKPFYNLTWEIWYVLKGEPPWDRPLFWPSPDPGWRGSSNSKMRHQT